jgi:hypothetical protein
VNKPALKRGVRSRAKVNHQSHKGESTRSGHKKKLVITESPTKRNGQKVNGHVRLQGRAGIRGRSAAAISKTPSGLAASVTTNSKPFPVIFAASASGTLVQRDGRLVARCLAGDVVAWSEIYQDQHDSLLVLIRRFLNRAGRDVNLVEEIAARVWYVLIKNDFELLSKFDVTRGCRLATYLAVVAKNETRVLFRSERRRKTREQLASRPDITAASSVVESSQLVADDEFLVTLSQAERTFFQDVLMAPPVDREEAEQAYSAENNWQLRSRVRKKLEQYISQSDA